MNAANAQQLVAQAYRQQELTGRADADVSVFVPGKWPDAGRKRLDGRKGPLGRCAVEYEDAVMCLFKADELIAYCAKFLPTITINEGER